MYNLQEDPNLEFAISKGIQAIKPKKEDEWEAHGFIAD